MVSGEYRPPKILQKLAEAAQTPEDRAAIAVKALEFLSIVRFEDTEVVRKCFDDAARLVEAVESVKERDYLRRILIEAAQTAFPRSDKIAAIDELLDRIEDGDERQNALNSRLRGLAKNLGRSEDYATARAAIMDRVEEIEDLRQYEEILAFVYAADLANGRSIEELEPLTTPKARIILYDTGLMNLAAFGGWLGYPEGFDQAISEALRVLDDVEKTLDTGVRTVDGETEELDAEELEDLRKEASELVVCSPKAAGHFTRIYKFAERCGAYKAVLAGIQLLASGVEFPDSSLFPLSAGEYVAALYVAAVAATKLAGEDPSKLAQLSEKLMPCIHLMLRVESLGDGDDDPRSALFSYIFQVENRAAKLAEKSESDLERVDCYAAILRGRVQGKVKTLVGTLVSALTRALDQLRPTPTRLYHKKRLFSLIVESCRRPDVVQFIESEEDPDFRRTLGAMLAAFDRFSARPYADLADRLSYDDFDVDLTKTDPLTAAAEFLDHARFVRGLPELQLLLTDDKK